MSKFTKFTSYKRISRTRYVTTASMTYELGSKGSGLLLVIDAGTEFDISVPRWLEWLQSPHDRQVLLAALIHDELGNRGYGVVMASNEFRIAAQALGSHPMKAWGLFIVTLAYTAIWRLFHLGRMK